MSTLPESAAPGPLFCLVAYGVPVERRTHEPTPLSLAPSRAPVLGIAAYVAGRIQGPGRQPIIQLVVPTKGRSFRQPRPSRLWRASPPRMHLYPDGGSVDLRRAIGRFSG